MTLEQLPELIATEPAVLSVLGQRNAMLAVPDNARALVVAGLAEATERRPIVLAVASTIDAERVARDLEVFLRPHNVELLPAWETLPFERVSPGVETMGRRLRTFWRLRDRSRMPMVIVAPVRALIQRLGPGLEDLEPVTIEPGDTIDPGDLVNQLVQQGYRREYQVEHRGEVAVRGSIVDVFPSTADTPYRIDLWGDEVDRLTEFTVNDQRSTDDVESITIFGCRELILTGEVRERARNLIASAPWGREHWERLSEGSLFDGMESWTPWLATQERLVLDLLPEDSLILLSEPSRMRDRAKDLIAEEADLALSLARTWGAVADTPDADAEGVDADAGDADGHGFPSLHLSFDRVLAHTTSPVWTLTNLPESPDTPSVAAHGFGQLTGDDSGLMRQLKDLLDDGYRVIVAADGAGSAGRVQDLLAAAGLHFTIDEDRRNDLIEAGGHIVIDALERGVVMPEIRTAVLAESDITGRRRAHRRAKPRKRQAQGFFDDLAAGDYVVHHQHGVAKFSGMVKRAIGGSERDYLLLEYRGGDKLYVPSDQVDAVRHYTGGDSPSLSRLSGNEWQKTKGKVRAEVEEVAQELVVLYQRRANTEGHAFAPDTPWQRELADAFPFEETPDQLTAIADVTADMEADTPMDRLVCGDVGFGKTEVAIRAAFKAVQDGKQAAVLVPTTLLAQQHFQTFSERFAPYPVRVEMLSRFLTPAQSRKVMAEVASGEVDVVIGTHKLLSKELEFSDLGLLVVDEEQRFGVSHKESIKELKANVDVLTLTATPIPRTLEMSLTGIRDLTLLNTAPSERQPILTYVGEYDDRAAAEAIRRELLREGQVFFVHNRVQDIEKVANELRELVPEARIAIAHGQMDEGSLEKVVLDFWEGEYDVLVCTTIIESGIDMPTVNTLVVDRADLLGLGQLHQLRGRVGRAGSRAYAYLFTPQDRQLTDTAYERLKTIGEATELGSGFKIAMRDLEIRGAGNMLGTGQSGHIAAVGYDLYCQLVTEAVSLLKGETIPEPAEVKIELALDANLPADYVEREDLRIEAYRRLAAVQSQSEVDDIEREWIDRYGPVPDLAQALLDVARLRAECHRVGLREITVTEGPGFGGPAWTARMSPIQLKASQLVRMERLYSGSIFKEEPGQIVLPVKKRSAKPVEVLMEFLRTLVPMEESGAA